MAVRASTLSAGAAAIQNAVPRIEHREPVVRCEAQFAFEKNTGAMKAAAAESRTLSAFWKLRTAGCGDALQ
jgi:hypothetical protein